MNPFPKFIVINKVREAVALRNIKILLKSCWRCFNKPHLLLTADQVFAWETTQALKVMWYPERGPSPHIDEPLLRRYWLKNVVSGQKET